MLKLFLEKTGQIPYSTVKDTRESILLDTVFHQHTDEFTGQFEIVDSPWDADYIIPLLRSALILKEKSAAGYLEIIAGLSGFVDENLRHKYVFIASFDTFPCEQLTPLPFFTHSVNRFNKLPGHFSLPLYSEDLSSFSKRQKNIYDASFIGAATHPVRTTIAENLPSYCNSYAKLNDIFFWNEPDASKRQEIRNSFLKICAQSRFVLCPRGFGENSFRFFETISLGRIPIIISDSVEMPFEDIIDYDEFSFRIGEDDLREISSIVKLDDRKYAQMQQKGREIRDEFFTRKGVINGIVHQLKEYLPFRDSSIFKENVATIVSRIDLYLGQRKAITENLAKSVDYVWKRITECYSPTDMLALAGAGQYAEKLLAAREKSAGGPGIVCLLDDSRAQTRLNQIPIESFSKISELSISAIFVCTDSFEPQLTEKCREHTDSIPIFGVSNL